MNIATMIFRAVLPSVLIICGVLLIFMSSVIFKFIIRTNLILAPNSTVFESWKSLSERFPMDFYMFNWTNPQDIYNLSTKPKFQELGPYRYMFNLTRTNITWNTNGTLTYSQKKDWFYESGDLKDNVTTINVPAVGAAHTARTWNYFVRKGLSISLNKFYSDIYTTRTIDEMLFKGYDDPLTRLGSALPMFAGMDVPSWDKFAFFYKRNGSNFFEGMYNVGTGTNSTFGKVYSWNYLTEIPYYKGKCRKIDSSSGDNYSPDTIQETLSMFLPELCRPLIFEYVGNTEVDGILGYKYILGDRTLDNGTLYPENKCYCNGECLPSGIFNSSACRYGSPTFPSLPHFYKADPYYITEVEGLHPQKDKHEFYIVVEPNTGIPIEVAAKIQINFLLHAVPDITLFENVPKVIFPIMWFDQRSKVPSKDLPSLKLLLKIPSILIGTGIIAVILGLIIILWPLVIKKNETEKRKEEEIVPLKQNGKIQS